MAKYVNILLARNTDRLFTYRVPLHLENEIVIGNTVSLLFRNMRMTGFVVEFVPEPDLKTINDIQSIEPVPPVFGQVSVRIAHDIADYYCCSFLTALYLYLPPGLDKNDKKLFQDSVKIVSLKVQPHIAVNFIKEYEEKRKTAQMAELLKLILNAGNPMYQEVILTGINNGIDCLLLM